MKHPGALIVAVASTLILSPARADDLLDRVDEALRFSAFGDNVRARLSGTLDLEFYHFQQPAPALIDAQDKTDLFNPRLSLFVDAQLGPQVYFFSQTRIDRHFDPSDGGAQIRLDEYALRVTPWNDGRVNIQAGKFSTVVGTWVERHLSWDNPFVTAPLVYENTTAIEDRAAPVSALAFVNAPLTEKYEHNPVIWGPSYASGLSVAGRIAQFRYAAEIKNTALAARPESWQATKIGFERPTFSGRLGFQPSQMWNFGVSASNGAYLLPEAASTLPAGRGVSDYREIVVAQDATFAWHHLQIWAEFFEARFEVPNVGNADTLGYYIEAKYKFTPQFFGAVRWNQQLFGDVPLERNVAAAWGHDRTRVDFAAGYRFTPHIQLKLQYNLEHEKSGARDFAHTFAAQFTLRF